MVSKDELERQILDMWLTTQIPLTRAHIQYKTGLGRAKLGQWLDELVVEGALGLDVGDDGEMIYQVPGAERPKGGARSFSELGGGAPKPTKASKKVPKARQVNELEDLQMAMVANQAKGLAKKAGKALAKKDEDDKSVLVSAALSFFAGPLGWFYAGSFKEAAVGSAALLVLVNILPSFLLYPILFLLLPVSGIAGLIYGWQHNRKGERTPLFLGKGDSDAE